MSPGTNNFGHRYMVEFYYMPIIESYKFGRMIIDGTSYTKDVIIYPDGNILSPWWRKHGHVLELIDLQDLIAAAPELIICGTGTMGIMRPSAALKEYLGANNIDFIALRTSKIVETYNKLSGDKKVGACFHLTC
jgi:hypothetical protein